MNTFVGLSSAMEYHRIFPLLEEDSLSFVIDYNGTKLCCENKGDGNYTARSFFSKEEDQWKALTSNDSYFEEEFYILELLEYEEDDDGEKIPVGVLLRLGAVEGSI